MGSVEFLFFDLNAFFASVEQQDDPRLRGRPVGVLPVDAEGTCVIAASYEAKAFGISTGTRLREARRRCPDLVVIPARHEVYIDYHHRVLEEVGRHLPIEEVCSIDEGVCRLAGDERRPERAVALARAVKAGVARNVGEALRLSVGIAPSRLLAKLASDMRKPDGLVVLTLEDLPEAVAHLPLSKIPGIGEGMKARLFRRGVTTVEALWRLHAKQARAIWGGLVGERLWLELHGHALPPVKTKRRSIGHGRVLAPDMRAPGHAWRVARALALKAASRMRRMGFAASALMLSVRLATREWCDASRRFPPTQDSFVLLAALDLLWRPMMRSAAGRSLYLVSVHLHELKPADGRQGELFGPPGAFEREALWASIDALSQRHGRGTVRLGSQMGLDLADLGLKIAFTRIPDRVETME